MPYINFENWEHCKEFVDYLYQLHLQERRADPSNITKYQELMQMCSQIHQRSYRARINNLFKRETEYSHHDFVDKVVEWMKDNQFLTAPGVNYPYYVRFDASFAPNLAYVFEWRAAKYKKSQSRWMASFESALNFWQRLNQPSWQKNVLWVGLASSFVLSGLVSFGVIPAIPIVIAGSTFFTFSMQSSIGLTIGLTITGGVSYFLDQHEKSKHGHGLYRDNRPAPGLKSVGFTESVQNTVWKNGVNLKQSTNNAKTPVEFDDNPENNHSSNSLRR
jgi:hypothetical protein